MTILDKKQRFRYQANYNQIAESDTDQKGKIISILRKEFGIHGITGIYVSIPGTTRYRLPDIFIPQRNPQIILELDGRPHGNDDEISQSKQTKERNLDYVKLVNTQVIILHYETTDGYDDMKVISELEKNGLKRIG